MSTIMYVLPPLKKLKARAKAFASAKLQVKKPWAKMPRAKSVLRFAALASASALDTEGKSDAKGGQHRESKQRHWTCKQMKYQELVWLSCVVIIYQDPATLKLIWQPAALQRLRAKTQQYTTRIMIFLSATGATFAGICRCKECSETKPVAHDS